MKNLAATKLYTFAFGLFLGLCIWKFGNPVILDQKISAPVTSDEFLNYAWPLHWANWILLPLVGLGVWRVFPNRNFKPADRPATANSIFHLQSSILYFLPLLWLGWQFLAATQTVDADLTHVTLWQFSGCVACYLFGALIFSRDNMWRWLLPGLLIVFVFCLVRSVGQHVFEFPQSFQMLVAGEHGGWTNFLPETVAQMKADNIIITTNSVEIANPAFLEKFRKGRVAGTLVYPNALAGIILLLWPVTLALAFRAAKILSRLIWLIALGLALFLGGAALLWSGSKLGWLIAIGLAGLFALRLDWPRKLKLLVVALVLIFGLGIFAVRFHHYFAAGATSVGARLDCWRAAAQTTASHPLFGTGPGTFQRPYAELKSPASEMARLTHNDWLEQFSDSGILGGLFYCAWVVLALAVAGEKLYRSQVGQSPHVRFHHSNFSLEFAVFAGLLGWFAQGFGEFGLYIPALAWPAFTLLGSLTGADAWMLEGRVPRSLWAK